MAASRTAQYVALYRALETNEPSRPPLFRDPFARQFLSRSLDFAITASRLPLVRSALVRYADRRAPGARTSAIARTAFLDDAVRTAVAGGVAQIVILGAGFDCRAHRMPELAGATVYEVDRADTQAVKRARVAAAPNVRYVAVDFLRDVVDTQLRAAGWDAAKPTFVLWEGVTNYLTEAAVASVLAWVGSLPAPSAIAFTYIHRGVLDGTGRFQGAQKMVDNVKRMGEPWTFGIEPSELGAFVGRAGLVVREDLGADEYRARYLPGDHAGYAFYRICVATTRPS
ncbi:MAG: class I SAM-dependent methyltransferase [Kofleriaceae bacterium]